MSEQSRRAQKKALTRAHVQRTAQRLFRERGFDAVTIADVAASADVAVQTVFNHFPTKEELFWSDRSRWVTGPAAAVRDRAPGVSALRALREHLTESTGRFAEALATAEGRGTIEALDRSPALRAAERELHHRAEVLLRAALEEAWTGPDAERPAPADPHLTAALVATTWLATTRTLVTTLRDPLPAPADVPGLAERTRALTGRLLARLEEHALRATGTGVRVPDDGGPGVLRAV